MTTAYRPPTALSLFSGAGIGDIGLRAAGYTFAAQCEIEPDRAALCRVNFPTSRVLTADINSAAAELQHMRPALISCTAPCQGMSKNGQGKLLRAVREGRRPALDQRNRLILPALDIITGLRPDWVVFENVTEMRQTVIEDGAGRVRPILDIVFDRLGPDYVGRAYDVEFADYGVPQRRQRLITVATRHPVARASFDLGNELVPPPTHARVPRAGRSRWVSVSEALAGFPPLDAGAAVSAADPTVPFHRVPLLDTKKYEWVRHTAAGRSAFDNQCSRPECGFSGNPTHTARRDADGVNRASRTTPLHCERCGHRLPRPYTVTGPGTDDVRLMAGYTSAYKRMDADLPAPALTRNLSYACSDQKLHPTQNRVLSLAEAMRLHTLDRYDYRWGPLAYSNGGREVRKPEALDGLIRLVIGESVPPHFFELLGRHIRAMSAGEPPADTTRAARQLTLC